MSDASIQSVPLGALGTGAVEVCADGRFRNLTINNNRTIENRIPIAPHSFLAVRASEGGRHYVRRLQTEAAGHDRAHTLPGPGLKFRGGFPQVDFRVVDPDAPVEVVWSAFAPVVPYDYEASVLPVLFFAMQVTNTGGVPLDVSALLNWENTVGCTATSTPAAPPAIGRTTLVTEAEWERRTSQGQGQDNERRLSASSGQMASGRGTSFHSGDVKPNALVFGDGERVDANADGQYCVATPWSEGHRTSLAVWDPEDPAASADFWEDFSSRGEFDAGAAGGGLPRCGAVCNRFTLEPGASRRVEFVASWYCPRYASDGPDEGNFYATRFPSAQAVARTGLKNGTYYYAAIHAWQRRLTSSDLPERLLKHLFASCEVLGTNSIYTQYGDFGLFESLHDPRLNYLRDRWFWSMSLLLFFPRLELEILERMSERMVDEASRKLLISEGMEGFTGAEYVGPGAAQVEACVHLVTMTYRNYLFGGNLSFVTRLMPQLQTAMAAVMALDKDLDGIPDIEHEAPGLAGAFAAGLNSITAGLWLVALRACERLARRQKLAVADVYEKAYQRASRSFDHYFWNREFGYYTLYPDPEKKSLPPHELLDACHVGQLTAIWVANMLGLGDTFRKSRVSRALECIESNNIDPDGIRMIAYPGAGDPAGARDTADEAIGIYNMIRYTCTRLQAVRGAPDLDDIDRFTRRDAAAAGAPLDAMEAAPRHVSQLALWYLIVASPAAQLDLSEKRLNLRPDIRDRGGTKNYTLYTPNGFGSVSIRVEDTDAFECEVEFAMDIPQELASVVISIPEGLGEVGCTLEVEDDPVPCTLETADADNETVLLTVTPEAKVSSTGFKLKLRALEADPAYAAGRKPWISQWFRR